MLALAFKHPIGPVSELENTMKTTTGLASARAPDTKTRSHKTVSEPARELSVVPKARASVKRQDSKAPLATPAVDTPTEPKTPSPQDLLE